VAHEFSEKIFDNFQITYQTLAQYGFVEASPESISELLKQEKPDLVLVGTSSQQSEKSKFVIEQSVNISAKKLGIKSLAVLDFWMGYVRRFSDVFTGERFKYLPDKIAIMDETAREEMLKEGFDDNLLVITGNPYFDDLPQKAADFSETDKATIRQKIGLAADFLMFFASSSFKNNQKVCGYWDLKIIKIIAETMDSLPTDKKQKTGLVLRLHPRTPEADRNEIEEYLKKFPENRIKIVKDISSQELILASDLALTPDSTVAVESVYLGKPCLSLQPGLKIKDELIVSRKGIIPAGYSENDCRNLLAKAIQDKEFLRGILEKEATFRTDGQATKRVINLVYEMLGKI